MPTSLGLERPDDANTTCVTDFVDVSGYERKGVRREAVVYRDACTTKNIKVLVH